jgi:carbon storage regulator
VLVLTRRAGESIVIGDDVRVVVLDVRGDTVRLGIDAPRSVQVHRAEVYAEVQAANAAAVSSVDDLGAVADRLQRIARPATGRRPERAARTPRTRPAGEERPDAAAPSTPAAPAGPAAPAEPRDVPVSAPAPRSVPGAPVVPAQPAVHAPSASGRTRPKPAPPPSRPR